MEHSPELWNDIFNFMDGDDAPQRPAQVSPEIAGRAIRYIPRSDHQKMEGADEREYTADNWQEGAECQYAPDPEIFFDKENFEAIREAKRICHECVVRDWCLDYALTNEERVGIWGGKSERERSAIRRRLRTSDEK